MKTLRRSYSQITTIEKEQIIQMYYQGFSFSDMYNSTNLSKRNIARVFKEYNICTARKNRYLLNENYFEILNTANQAYILGLLFADGYSSNIKNAFILSFAEKDCQILYDIKEEFSFTGEIKKSSCIKYDKERVFYTMNFSCQKLREDLCRLGFEGLKQDRLLNIPQLLNSLPRNMQLAFVRGYIDGDGGFYPFTRKEKYINSKGDAVIYEYDSGMLSVIGPQYLLDLFAEILDVKHSSLNPSKTDGLLYWQVKKKSELKKIYHLLYDNATLYMNRKKSCFEIYVRNLEEKSSKEKSEEPIVGVPNI